MCVTLLRASPDPPHRQEREGLLRVCQYSMGNRRFDKSCEYIHMYLGSETCGLASNVEFTKASVSSASFSVNPSVDYRTPRAATRNKTSQLLVAFLVSQFLPYCQSNARKRLCQVLSCIM